MAFPTAFCELAGIEHPLVQAPMAGASTTELAVAVCAAGALGSLACGMLEATEIPAAVTALRAGTERPFNLNFFCHEASGPDEATLGRWAARLAPFYREYGLEPSAARVSRTPFGERECEVIEEVKPAVVSFHFGLPAPALVERVKQAGCVLIASATTVAEARWLEERGCDAVIAQGAEAGGHRGMFLTEDVAAQVGTMALVPQVVDAVEVPVIAAGGIGDARGIVAAFALGAAAVQLGTAYLRCPETTLSPLHLARLAAATDDGTVLADVFTGRPARAFANRLTRELGPLAPEVAPFPAAAGVLLSLREAAEQTGSPEFSMHLAGQAAPLGQALPAGALTRSLTRQAAELAGELAGS